MKKMLLFILCAGIYPLVSISQNIDIAKNAVQYLASDSLKGRFPGTPGDSLSIDYITSEFKTYGLKPFDFGYAQEFKLVTEMSPGEDTYAILDGEKLIMGSDFMPLNFSAEASHKGKIVIAGESFKQSEINTGGAWGLIVINNKEGEIPPYGNLVKEAVMANEQDAKGLIIVSRNPLGENSEFYPFKYTRSAASMQIPVIQLSQKLLKDILEGHNLRIADVLETDSLSVDVSLKAKLSVDKTYSHTANLAGYAEGVNKDKWLVIGAHHDHLGMGGRGSGSRTPARHAVHNGADDNASGVAMVLMLADYYSAHRPDINMAFVCFGAEEQGLIGSNCFVSNMPFDAENVKAMINYDMVGRLNDSSMSISGAGTGSNFKSVINGFDSVPLEFTLADGGFTGSDQAAFYSEKIPVLFFNSGLHDDYHTPDDDADKINYPGMKMIADFSVHLADSLMNEETPLEYRKVKQPDKSVHGGDMKVTLGIMPDVVGKVENGLGIDGVRPGGPAERAGMKKGDVIVKIGKKEIDNIYDYMHVMSEFEEGDKLKIHLIRDNKRLTKDIKF